MLTIRAILFYLGMATVTPVFTMLGLVMLLAPFRMRFAVVSRWAAFNLWWLRVTCGVSFEVSGREHIPEQAGVILCKHQSAFETLALQVVFPAQAWVLKRELLWIPIYGWGLASMNPIAIDRSAGTRALRQMVRQGRRRLEQNIWVVVFPEGTRVAPGKRGIYQPGGGMIATESGRPVIPVAHNAGWFWPRNSFRKQPGHIQLIIGPPIASTGRSAKEITALAEAWIESTVAGLPAPATAESLS